MLNNSQKRIRRFCINRVFMMRLFWISLIYLISATGSYANICIPERGNFLKVMNVASDDTLNVRAGITTKTQVFRRARSYTK